MATELCRHKTLFLSFSLEDVDVHHNYPGLNNTARAV